MVDRFKRLGTMKEEEVFLVKTDWYFVLDISEHSAQKEDAKE